MQRSLAVHRGGADRCSTIAEAGHHLLMAVPRRHMQRCSAFFIDGVRVNTLLTEETHKV